MPTTLNCPNCNASLNFSSVDHDVSIHCDYCNSTVIVPEELRPKRKAAGTNEAHENEAMQKIVQLVQNGRKIEAIKEFRVAFGVGLKEAKEVIEAIERHEAVHIGANSYSSHFVVSSTTARTESSGGGCIGVLIIGALLLAIGVVAAGIFGGFEQLENQQINDVVDQINEAIGNTGAAEQQAEQADALAEQIAEAIAENEPESADADLLAEQIAEAIQAEQLDELLSSEVITLLEEEGVLEIVEGQLPAPTNGIDEPITLQFGGEEGNGPGFFNDTRTLGVDAGGNIYTGDFEGGRVQVFDANGRFLRQINVGDELYMTSMAVDRQGIVYVVQWQGILRFDGESGEALSMLANSGNGRFEAVGATIDGGIVAVGEEQLVRFDADGNETLTVADPFAAIDDFRMTYGSVDVDGAGNIYVLSSEAIIKLNADGQFVDQIGSIGDGADQFRITPTAITVDGRGNLYVKDLYGVKIFDGNGRFLDIILAPGAIFDMLVTDDDQLLVMDRNNNEVRQYDLGEILQ